MVIWCPLGSKPALHVYKCNCTHFVKDEDRPACVRVLVIALTTADGDQRTARVVPLPLNFAFLRKQREFRGPLHPEPQECRNARPCPARSNRSG